LLKSGESASVYLGGISPSNDTTFDICWGEPSVTATENPALEASLYYQNGASYYVSRKVWDPQAKIVGSLAVSAGNPAASNCRHDRSYTNYTTTRVLDFSAPAASTLHFLRLTLLHNTQAQYISVGSSGAGLTFPSQGGGTRVTGTSGDTTKVIQVFERTPEPLSIFNNALFAGGNIIQ
jgi:hypothetical protein